MATLTNYIRLVDGASGPLKSIANAGSRAIHSLTGMAGGTAGVHRVSEALAGVERNAESATNAMARMNNTVSNFTQAQRMSARYGMAGRMYNVGQNAMRNVKQNTVPKVTQTVQRVIRFVPDRIIGDTGLTARAFGAIESAANRARMSINRVPSAMHEVGEAAGQVDNATNSFKGLAGAIGSISIGTMVGNIATQALEQITALPGQLVHIAGEYAGIQARLKLLVGDQAKVAEMNEAIYQSALRSRGSFEQMADAVTKIGMTAKEAFPNPKEVVPFVEGIQKLFAIGGTGAQQQGDAMLQLTQALGSGKLQGDEFRSIAEAAPLIEQMVAKYMGVTQGALKELSSTGAITADILKNAILSNLDEINSQFATMPMTFDQQMQRLGTIAYKAFTPVFEVINKALASPVFQSVMDKLATGITVFANALLWALDLAGKAFNGIANNLEWLKNTIFGASTTLTDVLVPALAFVAGFVGALVVLWTIFNAAQIVSAVISEIVAAAQLIASGATTVWAVATTWLAAAINFCTGGVGIFLAVILGIPIIVATIVGAFFAWKVATNGLRATFVSAFETIGNVIDSVVTTAASAINSFIDMVNSAASAINNAFGWAGANIQMTGHVSVADLGGNTHGARWRQWAADTYDNTAEWVSNMFKPPEIKPIDMSSISGGNSMPSTDDVGKALKGNTGRTADNTGRMADSLDLLEEDIKDMRYATQEQINKYTNAKVTIEVGGINNTISSDTDVDGVMSKIVEALQEGMSNGAEAVLY